MDALIARGVSRKYGRQQVLQDFDLTLEAGSFEALMGPSGSGKSTFLHVAAGLLAADAGTIEIGGADIVAMGDGEVTKFRRRHIGVVFQQFNLLNEKTVEENIILPVKLDGRKVERARLESLVARLGIGDKMKKRPEELSGGEQQRVAIARALMNEPEVILADEPTGNLDAKSAKEICGLLRELNQFEKSAILVVTHDPVVAANCRKVNFLKDGKIAAVYETDGDAAKVSELYLETYK